MTELMSGIQNILAPFTDESLITKNIRDMVENLKPAPASGIDDNTRGMIQDMQRDNSMAQFIESLRAAGLDDDQIKEKIAQLFPGFSGFFSGPNIFPSDKDPIRDPERMKRLLEANRRRVSGPDWDRHPEELETMDLSPEFWEKFNPTQPQTPKSRTVPNWGDNEADPTIMDSERGRAANGGRIGYALGGSGNQMLNDSAQGIGSMVAFNDEEDYSLDDDALRTDPMELLDQIEAQGALQTADMGIQEDPLMLYIMEQYEMMKDQGNLPAKYMGTNGMKLFLEEVGPVIISELEKQQGAGIASLQA